MWDIKEQKEHNLYKYEKVMIFNGNSFPEEKKNIQRVKDLLDRRSLEVQMAA